MDDSEVLTLCCAQVCHPKRLVASIKRDFLQPNYYAPTGAQGCRISSAVGGTGEQREHQRCGNNDHADGESPTPDDISTLAHFVERRFSVARRPRRRHCKLTVRAS